MSTLPTKPDYTPETAAAEILKYGGDYGARSCVAIGIIRAYADPRPHGAIASWTPARRLAAIQAAVRGLDLAHERRLLGAPEAEANR